MLPSLLYLHVLYLVLVHHTNLDLAPLVLYLFPFLSLATRYLFLDLVVAQNVPMMVHRLVILTYLLSHG